MSPNDRFDLVIHATHEAGVKVGGIGAVLDGLLGSRAYNERVAHTILVGPMDTTDPVEMERLVAPPRLFRSALPRGMDSWWKS